jgi:uronate dehydrogenase
MSATSPATLVTGAGGVIGTVLRAGLDRRLTPYDLPENDARDQRGLRRALKGSQAAIHLAWDTSSENLLGGFAPDNILMALTFLEASAAAGLQRVVLASSVHADTFSPLRPGTLVDVHRTPTPDSAYGASKLWMEAYGRHVADTCDLEVVAIRFGGVNPLDTPAPDAVERAVWLPHRDCVSLVAAALTQPLNSGRFALVHGVGANPGRVHAFSDDLAWRPAPQ